MFPAPEELSLLSWAWPWSIN